VYVVLLSARDYAERGVYYVQMRVDAERRCKEKISLTMVAVEKVSIVKIAIGA
jgi:hypothetical protein